MTKKKKKHWSTFIHNLLLHLHFIYGSGQVLDFFFFFWLKFWLHYKLLGKIFKDIIDQYYMNSSFCRSRVSTSLPSTRSEPLASNNHLTLGYCCFYITRLPINCSATSTNLLYSLSLFICSLFMSWFYKFSLYSPFCFLMVSSPKNENGNSNKNIYRGQSATFYDVAWAV